jgi:P pilus assembly chaperone PapD
MELDSGISQNYFYTGIRNKSFKLIKITVMKPKFIMMLLTAILIISCISSCQKKDLASPGPTQSAYNGGTSQLTLNLTAGSWVQNASGVYVNTFRNIIPSNSTAKVYLLKNNDEIPITNLIIFMGGELWATTIQTDVKINFRYSGYTLPFSYLNIKVVAG